MASLEYHIEGSLDGILGKISYIFSFVFYGFIKAITEAVYRWFHFLSTASVWLQHLCINAYLRVQYTSLLFTRSVHQPPAYASGAPLKH